MEMRVFGPPGTGKTTGLERRIAAAVKRYGRNGVLVSSFTRAASAEISGRGIDVNPDNVGTLHAICYRMLSHPTLTEGKHGDFNAAFPHFKLSSGIKSNTDEPAYEIVYNTDGDKLAAQHGLFRARMVPRELWPHSVLAFDKAWSSWKVGNGIFDFTDLIEVCLNTVDRYKLCDVGFFDEAQDFTKLQATLVRKWGDAMEHFLLAGDDDQMIFTFAGATIDAFLEPPISDKQKEVLSQSYRVSRAVHAASQRWAGRLSRREPKEYLPTGIEGEVARLESSFRSPEKLLRFVESELAKDRSVMILGACSYHVAPTAAVLKKEGIPFHNPYRTNNGQWNPLGNRKGWTARDKLEAFLAPEAGFPDSYWSATQLKAFAKDLGAKCFIRGGKKGVQGIGVERDEYTDLDEFIKYLYMFFDDGFVGILLKSLIDGPTAETFLSRVIDSKLDSYAFATKCINRGGLASIQDEPSITVGTIHSVKGGEADTVVLYPDLSNSGYVELGINQDAIVRQFYVGMTRARDKLMIAQPEQQLYVRGLI